VLSTVVIAAHHLPRIIYQRDEPSVILEPGAQVELEDGLFQPEMGI
jgi:hypothetical protein